MCRYGSVTRGTAKRAVGDAGPYESVTRSADGRADVCIGPYGGVIRGTAKRAVGEIGEALPVAEEARRFRGSAPIGGHDSGRESVSTTVGKRTPPLRSVAWSAAGCGCQKVGGIFGNF